MSNETWERDDKGNLIPHTEEIIITDKLLEKEIELLVKKLESLNDDTQIEVHKRAITLLRVALSEKTETIQVSYTPLLNFEIERIKHSIGLDGRIVNDLDAQICALHCKNPKKKYLDWEGLKDPKLKLAISALILERSFPKPKKNEKQMEAMMILEGKAKEISV